MVSEADLGAAQHIVDTVKVDCEGIAKTEDGGAGFADAGRDIPAG